MATIDADAHVIESDHTWDYMGGADAKYKPVPVAPTEPGSNRLYWIIDGKLKGRRTNIGADTTELTREMTDVSARLRHMDELGVDVQILFPTIYTRKIAEDPAADLALGKSYNRWLADIFSQGQGRLRWIAIAPLLDLSKARAELEFAKEHGACGIMMRGFEGERHLSSPYFYPLYEIAQELDLAICIHAGSANPAIVDFMGSGNAVMVRDAYVADTDEQAWAEAGPEITRFWQLSADHRWCDEPVSTDDLPRLTERFAYFPGGLTVEKMKAWNTSLIGSPETVIRKAREMIDAGPAP